MYKYSISLILKTVFRMHTFLINKIIPIKKKYSTFLHFQKYMKVSVSKNSKSSLQYFMVKNCLKYFLTEQKINIPF